MRYDHDLFISYARVDNSTNRITELLAHIKGEYANLTGGQELRAFMDINPPLENVEGLRPGDYWQDGLLQALRGAHLFLACVSPSYIQSVPCRMEFTEFTKHELARALLGKGVTPVYFVEVPNWNVATLSAETAEFIQELRRRHHVDLRPWFQHGSAALKDAAVRAQMDVLNRELHTQLTRVRGATDVPGNVDRHNEQFVGRTSELLQLRRLVTGNKIGVITAVHGLGGMGKTALVNEFAYQDAAQFPGGRWQVHCEGRSDLRDALRVLQGARDLEFDFTEAEQRDLDRAFERVLRELKRRADAAQPSRVLLILDNVDCPSLLHPQQIQRLPQQDWLNVITTTQLLKEDLFPEQSDRAFLAVDHLPMDDAVELIRKHQPQRTFRNPEDRCAAEDIVRLLEGFTLAVETAAVYLGHHREEVDCTEFQTRLELEGLAGLEQIASGESIGVRHGETSLVATLAPLLRRLRETDRVAVSYATLLPADHVALRWLRVLVARRFPVLGHDADIGYPDPWRNLLMRLFSYRLLQTTEVRSSENEPLVASMHRMIQNVVASTPSLLSQDIYNDIVELLFARVNSLDVHAVPRDQRWELDCIEAWCHEQIESEDIAGRWIALDAAQRLNHLNEYARAGLLMRKTIDLISTVSGPNHPDLILLLCQLTETELRSGDLDEAERLSALSLEIAEANCSEHDLRLAPCYNNRGQILRRLDRTGEAEAAFRQALSIFDATPDEVTADRASVTNNLALLLQDDGRFQEADSSFHDALRLFEGLYGRQHPEVACVLGNLAILDDRFGRDEEAEHKYLEAIQILEDFYGQGHPATRIVLHSYGAFLHSTGRLEEAVDGLERALPLFEEAVGAEHHTCLKCRRALASVRADLGQSEEALTLIDHVLACLEARGEADPGELMLALNTKAEAMRKAGRAEEAEPLYRRALEIAAVSFETGHTMQAIIMDNLGLSLQAAQRYEESASLHREALNIFEQHLETDAPKVANCLRNWASLKRKIGQPESALPMLRRAAEIYDRLYGANHIRSLHVAFDQIQTLLDAHRWDEAWKFTRRAMSVTDSLPDARLVENAWRLSRAMETLRTAGRLSEAEEGFRRILDMYGRNPKNNASGHAAAMSNLALVLRARNELGEAESLYHKAVELLKASGESSSRDAAFTYDNYAFLLMQLGRLEEAETFHKKAIDLFEQHLGPDHEDYGIACGHLANVYMVRSEFSKARQLWQQAIGVLLRAKEATGKSPAMLQTAIHNYQTTLTQLGYSAGDIKKRLHKLRHASDLPAAITAARKASYEQKSATLACTYCPQGDSPERPGFLMAPDCVVPPQSRLPMSKSCSNLEGGLLARANPGGYDGGICMQCLRDVRRRQHSRHTL